MHYLALDELWLLGRLPQYQLEDKTEPHTVLLLRFLSGEKISDLIRTP